MFGDALDMARVRFRRAKWWWFQPRHVVMAPDGDIWFHPANPDWRDDFGTAPLTLRAFVVHELVHVWQHQCGVNLILRRGPLARYDYRLKPGKPFAKYGIEQQAEIVRTSYLQRARGEPVAAAEILPFGSWTTSRR